MPFRAKSPPQIPRHSRCSAEGREGDCSRNGDEMTGKHSLSSIFLHSQDTKNGQTTIQYGGLTIFCTAFLLNLRLKPRRNKNPSRTSVLEGDFLLERRLAPHFIMINECLQGVSTGIQDTLRHVSPARNTVPLPEEHRNSMNRHGHRSSRQTM